MPIILGLIVKIERRSDAPNVGVHLIVISNGRYYVYTVKPSYIPIPSYYY